MKTEKSKFELFWDISARIIVCLGVMMGVWMFMDAIPKPNQLPPQKTAVRQEVIRQGSELIVRYNGIDDKPYELIYEARTQRVTLRRKALGLRPSSKDHDLVKSEVIRLVSAKDPINLGDSGLSFYFLGGYPEWGPGEEYCGEGSFATLFFATDAVAKGDIIEAKGMPTKPSYYYPYPELAIRRMSGDTRDKGNIGAWYAWARMGLSAQYVSLHDISDLGR